MSSSSEPDHADPEGSCPDDRVEPRAPPPESRPDAAPDELPPEPAPDRVGEWERERERADEGREPERRTGEPERSDAEPDLSSLLLPLSLDDNRCLKNEVFGELSVI